MIRNTVSIQDASFLVCVAYIMDVYCCKKLNVCSRTTYVSWLTSLRNGYGNYQYPVNTQQDLTPQSSPLRRALFFALLLCTSCFFDCETIYLLLLFGVANKGCYPWLRVVLCIISIPASLKDSRAASALLSISMARQASSITTVLKFSFTASSAVKRTQ